jgi:hypothetical protein
MNNVIHHLSGPFWDEFMNQNWQWMMENFEDSLTMWCMGEPL